MAFANSLLERDPATYSIVSLRPLSSVAALVRSLENTQLFTVQVSNFENPPFGM